MDPRSILLRHDGPHPRPWRLYWAKLELASKERFATIAEAGAAARVLMELESERS